ncbi:UNVERIFIED_CONTAM: hypothetical protein K2H54_027816 [Gekko kuhli]
MDPSDSTSPAFVEKLKVYVECLHLERLQLENRALWAEQTVWEIKNEVSDLEKLLHAFGYCGTRRMERWCTPDGLPISPPLPSQPFRYFFTKIHRKSPDDKAAAQSPGTLAEESFGEVAPPKHSPVKEDLAKSPWTSHSKQGTMEAKSCVPLVRRVIFAEHRLPQSVSHSEAGSCWPPPEHSQRSTAMAPVACGDSSVGQDYGHWDPHLERLREGLARSAEDGSLGTTSTLLVATPSASGSEDIRISSDSSVSLDINPSLQKSKMERCNVWSDKLATMEGNCEIKRHGEGSTGKEEECVTLGSISLKSVGPAGQVPENLSDAQTDPRKLDNSKAKTFQDLSGHAALQTEVSFPGKDSPNSGQSQSIRIVHSSNQTADLEPEQVSCSLDLLQKLGKELSSLEQALKSDLPSSSIKALETNEPLGEKRVLEDAPGVNNKTNQPIPMEEDATIAFPPQLRPEELLLSDLYNALTSVSLESPQPTSLMSEIPSNLAEETAVEEN